MCMKFNALLIQFNTKKITVDMKVKAAVQPNLKLFNSKDFGFWDRNLLRLSSIALGFFSYLAGHTTINVVAVSWYYIKVWILFLSVMNKWTSILTVVLSLAEFLLLIYLQNLKTNVRKLLLNIKKGVEAYMYSFTMFTLKASSRKTTACIRDVSSEKKNQTIKMYM